MACKTIHIVDDSNYEKDERFSISLTRSALGSALALTAFLPGTKTIVIQDNDGKELEYSEEKWFSLTLATPSFRCVCDIRECGGGGGRWPGTAAGASCDEGNGPVAV